MTAAVTPAPFDSGARLIDGQSLDNAFAYPIVSTQDAITATPSGTQATSLILSATVNRISTVASTNDGVRLPVSKAGSWITLINDGANAMQVFGHLTATINDVTSATGISQAPLSCVTYFCPVVGKWYTDGTGAGNYTGNFDGIIGATTPAAGTFTTLTGTVITGGIINGGDTAVASATLTLNSSATLTNVVGMVVTVVPGTYRFRVDAPCVSTANTGIKVGFKLTTAVITSGAIAGIGFSAAACNMSAYSTTVTDQALWYDTAAGVELKLQIDGTLVIGTGGTMQFQMGQHTSHADSTSIFAGAYMTFTRIA